jgi:hypothetical protein
MVKTIKLSFSLQKELYEEMEIYITKNKILNRSLWLSELIDKEIKLYPNNKIDFTNLENKKIINVSETDFEQIISAPKYYIDDKTHANLPKINSTYILEDKLFITHTSNLDNISFFNKLFFYWKLKKIKSVFDKIEIKK